MGSVVREKKEREVTYHDWFCVVGLLAVGGVDW